jgi:DNA-directed RNA polymerase subunit RPC12/RpoP
MPLLTGSKKEALCRMFGHKLDEMALQCAGELRCSRCGLDLETSSRLQRTGASIRWELGVRADMLKAWYRCGTCGRRFGRHDSNVDHLPF